MPKAKLRADRGFRYRMVLELEADVYRDLEKLVARYQKLLGATAKANKALVLRQLIRDAASRRGPLPAQD
jgi:hypothetical protein